MRTLTPHPPLNYAALEKMLLGFGFTKVELAEPPAFFFEHSTFETTVILPKAEPKEMVQPLDLITVRRTLLESGIASLERYTAAINRHIRTIARKSRRKSLSQSVKVPIDPSPTASNTA